jgi:hypothetical protein
MLKVRVPDVCQNEQRYVMKIMLSDFLGLVFEIEFYSGEFIEITRVGDSSKLTLDASFFHQAHQSWLEVESMPTLPLTSWSPKADGINANLIKPSVPVLYGQPGLTKGNKHTHLNLDIFGSAFFMLSRYEEIVNPVRDAHDRYPLHESLSFKEGFLDRPIVNEYLEILWECIELNWPEVIRSKRVANKFITCDLDYPFDPAIYSLNLTMKKSLKLFLLNGEIRKGLNLFRNYFYALFRWSVKDDYRNAIDWIMDVNEEAGNRVAFYFITHKTSIFDSNIDFQSKPMKELISSINIRGHEIGIHPGYETYNNYKMFKKSVSTLHKIFSELEISQAKVGGRQHLLRWDPVITPSLWNAGGLSYDSTLGYAEMGGFRCGVCYEYTMYDLVNRGSFKLKQRPLIVMEKSIISSRYEALGYSDKSMERFLYFKKICYKFDGDFVLLWHNSSFNNHSDKVFYRRVIQ